MIRGSVVIAALAVLLSLLLHAMGFSLTAPRLGEPPRPAGPNDTVELGNSFEDLVEDVTQPVEPEPAETPEPPVEEPPEPDPAEVPTSEVHVASDDPQQTYAPDTGTSELVQPVEPEPVAPETTGAEDPAEAEEAASDDLDETPDVDTAEAVETPEGTPDTAEPAVEAPIAPEPVEPPQLATLPEPPEAPDAEPPVVPEVEAAETDPPTVAAGEDGAESELAVTSSVRPQRPDRTPTPEPQGILGGTRDFSDLRYPTREIESPLTTYSRRGVDAFSVSDSGSRSGGRGPGNSDRTNYAGRVLVHLNRGPIIYAAARGAAKVFFEINPDGTLAWVDVIDRIGAPEVERAAKAQVQAASPFPPPPGGVSRKLTFVYTSD